MYAFQRKIEVNCIRLIESNKGYVQQKNRLQSFTFSLSFKDITPFAPSILGVRLLFPKKPCTGAHFAAALLKTSYIQFTASNVNIMGGKNENQVINLLPLGNFSAENFLVVRIGNADTKKSALPPCILDKNRQKLERRRNYTHRVYTMCTHPKNTRRISIHNGSKLKTLGIVKIFLNYNEG